MTTTKAASDAIDPDVPPAAAESIIADNKEKRSRSDSARAAVEARWTAVREAREQWIAPFTSLDIERSLQYLEDLRRIAEDGARIIETRMNGDKHIRCEWRKCRKPVAGLRPNGTPLWVSSFPVRDVKDTNIQRRIYFCSELCYQTWVREGSGARGSEPKK
jgi:hypothetical protein